MDYRHRSQPEQAAMGQMWDNLNIKIKIVRKESGKESVCVYTTESVCCTPETNTLSINSTPI